MRSAPCDFLFGDVTRDTGIEVELIWCLVTIRMSCSCDTKVFKLWALGGDCGVLSGCISIPSLDFGGGNVARRPDRAVSRHRAWREARGGRGLWSGPGLAGLDACLDGALRSSW